MRLHTRIPRKAIAAVELAFVLPVMLTLMMGTWELGRVLHVQQVMVNAAREGARIAAQGQTINVTGAYTQIQTTSGTPNVQQTTIDYLKGAGFTNTTGVTVAFRFEDGNTASANPFQATKNQRFSVTLTVPYNNVRITTLNLLGITNLQARVDWVSMCDDPFTINTTIPSWNSVP
ncbi:MAG: pilus assembly protein [Gemmataceae bacterium]|nr:pilus assembly protein [Gemmataceae bacterium]